MPNPNRTPNPCVRCHEERIGDELDYATCGDCGNRNIPYPTIFRKDTQPMTNPIQRLRPFAVGALTALLVAIFAVPSAAATQQGECSRYTDHSGHVPATYDYARFVEYDKDGHVIYDATFDVPQGGLYVDPQKAEYGNKSWDRVWKCKRSPTTTTVPPTTTTTEVPPSSTTTIPSTTSTSTPPTTTSTTSTTSSSSTSTTT